jgi:DNA polymerase-3 subunit delta'
MIKDLLKKTQPVVYQALENALKNRHVSHSYLFLGPAGTPKKQTAVLMAQSLLCEKARDDFACEECGTCRRVAAGEHLDVVLLNRRSIPFHQDCGYPSAAEPVQPDGL